jgi:heavy metal efflux system protein
VRTASGAGVPATTEAAVLAALAAAGKRDVVLRRARDEDLELLVPISTGDAARENAAIVAALAALPGVGWELPESSRADARGVIRARFGGADRDELARLASAAAAIWRGEPSLHGVVTMGEALVPTTSITPDRNALARLGLSALDLELTIELLFGHDVGRLYEGEVAREVVVRMGGVAGTRDATLSPEQLALVALPTADGVWVPVSSVARVETHAMPRVLLREKDGAAIDVLASPVGPTAAETARAKLAAGLTLPPGVKLTFGADSL